MKLKIKIIFLLFLYNNICFVYNEDLSSSNTYSNLFKKSTEDNLSSSKKVIEIYNKGGYDLYLFNYHELYLGNVNQDIPAVSSDLFGNKWDKSSIYNLTKYQNLIAKESGKAMISIKENKDFKNVDDVMITVAESEELNFDKNNYIYKIFDGLKEIKDKKISLDTSLNTYNYDMLKHKLFPLTTSTSSIESKNNMEFDFKLSSKKLENQNIDILFQENIQETIINKKIVKNNDNSNIQVRLVDDPYYSFSETSKYFSCKNAVDDLTSSIHKENLDELAKEFVKKHIIFFNTNLLDANFLINNIMEKPNFMKANFLCLSFKTAYQANNMNGFKTPNDDYLNVISEDCDNLMRNYLYKSLLKKKSQNYLVINEFLEDFIMSLENELNNERKINNSMSLIEKYVEFQTKQDEINEEIQMKNELKNIPLSKRVVNDINNRVRISQNKLKPYNIILENTLFQAALIKIFSEMYGSRRILPVDGGSLFFEISNESTRHIISAFYNESLLFTDELESFIIKARKKFDKEKIDVLLYCSLKYDYESILNGFLIFLSILIFTLSIWLLYCMFSKSDDEDSNDMVKEKFKMYNENENCIEVGGQEIKTEESLDCNRNLKFNAKDKNSNNLINKSTLKNQNTHEDFLKTDESQSNIVNTKLIYNDNTSIDISKKGSD